MEAQPFSLENDATRLSESSPASKEDTNETEKQACCDCSVFKRKMSTIIDYIKNFLLAISIIGLAKSLFSFGVFLYDVISKFYFYFDFTDTLTLSRVKFTC